jgi:hypothetical protein
VILLLLACSNSTADVTAYIEAVRATRDNPAKAAEMCERVGGDAGAECAAWAAAALARDGDPAAASKVCTRIDRPVWLDECNFLVAEETERTEGPEASAKRCHDAGRFTDKCLFHLWKDFAGGLSARPPAEAMNTYAETLAWADGALVVDHRLELRFWDTFFEEQFAGLRIDPALCDNYASRADVCRTVLPAALQRRLQRSARSSGRLPCPVPETAEARADAIRHVIGTEYAPTADLDEVALRYYARSCTPPVSPDPR